MFGDFRFNLTTRELIRIGNHGSVTPVTLGSRAADLLHLFLDRPGELITKREIMDAVWLNMAVEESNLTVQISALRRALGGRNGARYIQTVPGRGYRFTLWVDELASRIEDSKSDDAISADGASTAVLARRIGGLKTDAAARPSHADPIAAPEAAPRPPPFPLAAGLPELPAGAVPMAVSRAQTDIWWLFWLNGGVGIILGLVLVTAPDIATETLVSVLGFYWLMMGMLALVRVFVDQSVPSVWSRINGIVGMLAGVFVIKQPLLAALMSPAAIVAVLGGQGLIMGGLEIIIGVIGAGIASFILGTGYLLVGLLLLGSLATAALAVPLAFGVLFLVEGLALTVFAFRTRSLV